MKIFILLSSLSLLSFHAFSNVVLESDIDLSVCQKNGKSVRTGLFGKVHIQSDLESLNRPAMKTFSRLEVEGGYDGDPANYSCSYFTQFGSSLVRTEASINGSSIFTYNRYIDLTTLDKNEPATANTICDSYPLSQVNTSLAIVPTEAGQILFPYLYRSVLVNFYGNVYGKVVSGKANRIFQMTEKQAMQKISFTIGKRSISNTDDLLFTDCEAFLSIKSIQ